MLLTILLRPLEGEVCHLRLASEQLERMTRLEQALVYLYSLANVSLQVCQEDFVGGTLVRDDLFIELLQLGAAHRVL